MKTTTLLASCLIAVTGLFAVVPAGRCADMALAVLDLERLVEAHPQTKSSEAVLKSQVEEFENEQKEMREEEETLKDAFEALRDAAANKALSDAAREDRLEQAKAKYEELREHVRHRRETSRLRNKQLADQQLRLRERIVSDISDVVKGYAEEKGLALVIDKSTLGVRGVEGVVYHAPSLDITDAIEKLVNAMEPEGD